MPLHFKGLNLLYAISSCSIMLCSYVQLMARCYPESEEFHFQHHNVYASQVIDVDETVEFSHSSIIDGGTVSASLTVLPAAGLILLITIYSYTGTVSQCPLLCMAPGSETTY